MATKSFGQLLQDPALATDADLKESSYAIKFGDFGATDAARFGVTVEVMRAGLVALQAQVKAREAAQKAVRAARLAALDSKSPPVVTLRCKRCNRRATMNASLGPSCSDHYDDLSD